MAEGVAAARTRPAPFKGRQQQGWEGRCLWHSHRRSSESLMSNSEGAGRVMAGLEPAPSWQLHTWRWRTGKAQGPCTARQKEAANLTWRS